MFFFTLASKGDRVSLGCMLSLDTILEFLVDVNHFIHINFNSFFLSCSDFSFSQKSWQKLQFPWGFKFLDLAQSFCLHFIFVIWNNWTKITKMPGLENALLQFPWAYDIPFFAPRQMHKHTHRSTQKLCPSNNSYSQNKWLVKYL